MDENYLPVIESHAEQRIRRQHTQTNIYTTHNGCVAPNLYILLLWIRWKCVNLITLCLFILLVTAIKEIATQKKSAFLPCSVEIVYILCREWESDCLSFIFTAIALILAHSFQNSVAYQTHREWERERYSHISLPSPPPLYI